MDQALNQKIDAYIAENKEQLLAGIIMGLASAGLLGALSGLFAAG